MDWLQYWPLPWVLWGAATLRILGSVALGLVLLLIALSAGRSRRS